MTTFQPRPPYTEPELAALYPPQLRLQQVQVFLRHGERTPVRARFANTGVPAFWPYCSTVSQLRSAVFDGAASGTDTNSNSGSGSGSGSFSALEWKRRLETFGPNDSPVVAAGPKGEVDAICDMGMLTDRGRQTTLDLGNRLRHLYVEQLGFLPPTLQDWSFLHLRSTPVPRALESLQQAFHGLYPRDTRHPQLPQPTIVTRGFNEETLVPNESACRRFAVLARAFGQRAADRWNDSPEMDYLNKKLGKWMPEDSPRVAVDAHPRLSGVMDSINSTSAHGPDTKLPKEFYDPKVKQIIEKIGVEEWFDGYKESNEYRTVGIGALLGDVTSRMVGTAEQTTIAGEYGLVRRSASATSPARFSMSGCHDTTIAAVLASLGAFDNNGWPPFTSHLAVELFRHADQPISAVTTNPPTSPSSSWWPSLLGGSKDDPSLPSINRKPTEQLSDAEKSKLEGYYVRIRYNDKPVSIPGCKASGKHLEGDESFCTLEAFKSIVDKFTPRNWKEACQANLKSPSIPDKPEPAGY